MQQEPKKRTLTVLAIGFAALAGGHSSARELQRDVCVYGATPAGINAAIAAKQEGAKVVLIEHSRWVGGILGAGIKPEQDCPIPAAVGGLTKSKIFSFGDNPAALRADFEKWISDEGIEIIREHRIGSVAKEGTRITAATFQLAPPDEFGVPAPKPTEGKDITVKAAVFIDASYEGDLLAAAGVSYNTGREPKAVYNEEPAGVGPPTLWSPIDPYVTPGDPESGLLPLVDADHKKARGEGDDYTQAYNYRFYVTNDPEKRADFGVPANYDPAKFELVGRYVEHVVNTTENAPTSRKKLLRRIFPGWMNEGEYNYHRDSLVTIAPLGLSRHYQDGDWETRSKIWQEHKDYLAGLRHFLTTDPRVPENFRKETAKLGLLKEMHKDTGGWPNQLYVRISRRMEAPYKLTHADVLNKTDVADGVGLALYGVDTYPARRYAAVHEKTGKLGVATEGNMWIGGERGTGHPYPVPYRSITPKAEECANILVPVCFSATHIAYASARMEPVFAILGESAGVAAVQAFKANQDVQQLDVKALQARLLERGQILSWP
jgi:hypothetical protein